MSGRRARGERKQRAAQHARQTNLPPTLKAKLQEAQHRRDDALSKLNLEYTSRLRQTHDEWQIERASVWAVYDAERDLILTRHDDEADAEQERQAKPETPRELRPVAAALSETAAEAV